MPEGGSHRKRVDRVDVTLLGSNSISSYRGDVVEFSIFFLDTYFARLDVNGWSGMDPKVQLIIESQPRNSIPQWSEVRFAREAIEPHTPGYLAR